MSPSSKAYARAGVDIALAEHLLDQVKPDLKKARRPESLGAIGGFGGLFDISRLRVPQPVLVSSTDSVGTKVTVARLADDYRYLGADIVNHCANDIAVCGAEPLFFLDYYAAGKLGPAYVTVLRGLAKACRAGNIALVGGETAEMPGVYAEGECDLVGTMVGVVARPKILTGAAIRPGDLLVGLGSSGLHTNGYSLARRIFFGELGLDPADPLPGGGRLSVGAALLRPHINYAPLLLAAQRALNRAARASSRRGNLLYAAAHITGGGFCGNVPRILPDNCRAVIDTRTWTPPPVFRAIAATGKVAFDELYEVFNMGIGMVLVVHVDGLDTLLDLARAHRHPAHIIGRITNGSSGVDLVRAAAP
jgi:phosphoribosylformylglycinamidine cyclo-ligase